MRRVVLDLNDAADREQATCTWRRAVGFVPGQPNQGWDAEIEGSPARLAEYDDSAWEACEDVGEVISRGICFGWWRTTVELPGSVNGVSVAGANVLFETTIDDYGEVWVDGAIDLATGGVQGFNIPQRVLLTNNAVPGTKYSIACLAANGPLAKPFGGVFMRYATLAFELNR